MKISNFFPLLLKPKFIGLRNRWRSKELTAHSNSRDTILVIFGVLIMVSIYLGTQWILKQAQASPALASISPSLPISLISLMLLFTVTLSAVATSLGLFYLSEDLDLILSAPLSLRQFFFGRLSQVFISTVWMPLIFLLPFLLGFGVFYDARTQFFIIAPLLLIPYFIIPVSLSVVFASLLFRFATPIKPRYARMIFIFGAFILIALLISVLRRSLLSVDNSAEFLRLLSMLSLPNTHWLPSKWLSSSMYALLRPNEMGALPELGLLVFSAIAATTLAYLSIDLFHFRAFSQARNQRSAQTRSTKLIWLQNFGERLFGTQAWAIVAKEFRLLTRDITHLLELCMLFGLCMLYVYNIRTFHILKTLPEEQRIWWKGCMFLMNIAMVAFFSTAVATRFVYPSLSREGRAFWILKTSPQDLRQLMSIKFWIWFCPIGIMATIFFTASSYALEVTFLRLVIAAFITWVLCYGIVGAAIGFGAIFAYFTWEHPSELAASFGSFVFMVFSTVLIILTLLPSWFILFPIPIYLDGEISAWATYFVTFSFLALTLLLNRVACDIVYKRGEKALMKNESI